MDAAEVKHFQVGDRVVVRGNSHIWTVAALEKDDDDCYLGLTRTITLAEGTEEVQSRIFPLHDVDHYRSAFTMTGDGYPFGKADGALQRLADDTGEQTACEEAQSPDGTAADDFVTKPKHYTQWAVEPMFFIEVNNLPFSAGNVVKYQLRAVGEHPKLYDGLTEKESRRRDLEKGRRYFDIQLAKLDGNHALARELMEAGRLEALFDGEDV